MATSTRSIPGHPVTHNAKITDLFQGHLTLIVVGDFFSQPLLVQKTNSKLFNNFLMLQKL